MKKTPLKSRTPAEKQAKKEARAVVTGNPVSVPAKKKPIKKVSKNHKKTIQLDMEDQIAITNKFRAIGKLPGCEVCASKGFLEGVLHEWELHHVRTKAACPELRHVPANHVAICRYHHEIAHAKPAEFRVWFWKHRPEDAEAIKLPKEIE